MCAEVRNCAESLAVEWFGRKATPRMRGQGSKSKRPGKETPTETRFSVGVFIKY